MIRAHPWIHHLTLQTTILSLMLGWHGPVNRRAETLTRGSSVQSGIPSPPGRRPRGRWPCARQPYEAMRRHGISAMTAPRARLQGTGSCQARVLGLASAGEGYLWTGIAEGGADVRNTNVMGRSTTHDTTDAIQWRFTKSSWCLPGVAQCRSLAAWKSGVQGAALLRQGFAIWAEFSGSVATEEGRTTRSSDYARTHTCRRGWARERRGGRSDRFSRRMSWSTFRRGCWRQCFPPKYPWSTLVPHVSHRLGTTNPRKPHGEKCLIIVPAANRSAQRPPDRDVAGDGPVGKGSRNLLRA